MRPTPPPQTYKVKSFGCQMNVYDAGRMADALAPAGYDETADVADADLVILNTCHIRERASDKVFSELGKLRETKRDRAAEGRDLRLAVAGCVAQAEGAEILRRQPAVFPQRSENLAIDRIESSPVPRLFVHRPIILLVAHSAAISSA